MAQQTIKATTSQTPVATTSVIRLAITTDPIVNASIPNQNGNSTDETIDDSTNTTTTVAADTTKMIESDTDCSRTILVDTKALNRQKELDERYGG